MKRLLLQLIRRYQAKGGGEHFFGVECNFEPSCSEYTAQAIEKYGAVKGMMLGIRRIKRCNQTDLLNKTIDPLL